MESKKYSWMAFSSVCLCLIMWVGIAWDTFTLYAGPVVGELGITRTEFMFTLSIMTFVNAFGAMFVYGKLESKIGLRKMLCIAGICGTISFLLWSTMTSVMMLYAGAVIFGFCVAFSSNCATNSAVTYWFSRNRGTLISVSNMTGKISGVIFATVVAIGIAVIGWRLTFGLSCAVSAVCTVLVTILYKGKPQDVGVEPLGASLSDTSEDKAFEDTGLTLRQSMKKPQFYCMVALFFLIGITVYAGFGMVALFTIDYGYQDYSGTIVSVGLLGAVLGMVPIGKLCDKFGSKIGIAFCLICTIAGLFLFMQASLPLALMYIAAFVLGVGNQAVNVPAGVSVAEAFGQKEYSQKMAPIQACSYLGVSVGSPFLSLFYDNFGTYYPGLIVLVVLSVVVIVLGFIATRKAYAK